MLNSTTTNTMFCNRHLLFALVNEEYALALKHFTKSVLKRLRKIVVMNSNLNRNIMHKLNIEQYMCISNCEHA